MEQRHEQATRPGSHWTARRTAPWLAFALYMTAMTALLIVLGIPIDPSRYFFVMLGPVLLIRRARRFLFDWLPFLFLLFSYEFLRGLAGRVGQVHYLTALRFDAFVFGVPPSVTLQHRFFHPGTLAPYDYLAAVLYLLHFVLPLTFAYVCWLRSPERFARFTTAFLVLSYAALLTFVVFPAAPPWLAGRDGYLPEVRELVGTVLAAFPERMHLPTVYQLFDPNQVAAIPSLHAAYPMLILLFAVRFYGNRGLFLTPYVAATWLAVVYMGEHYVFDVLIGAFYSVAAFLLMEHALPRLGRGVLPEREPLRRAA